ncbi:MAG: desulfoferrodoxin [Spirochaetia bacterium]|jgi:superoxide reductase|nr:desulfoferrodoxin [Spirochaetia bacterium]
MEKYEYLEKKMHNSKFYVCKHCGNIIIKAHDAGVPVECCGEKMHEAAPNTTDAAKEKHVPAVVKDGSKITVTVGSTKHPMEEKHFIEWIYLVCENSTQSRHLHPAEEPVAEFILTGDKPLSVYEYCNLHGLWKADV